jgi:3-hydroxymyristoyl/3-hydroxydecanoyl-(acyl carrier protein) dehydratase
MTTKPIYDASFIRKLLPHQSPFLFVDRVMEIKVGEKIVAERDLLPDETFFSGHFPGRPLMPGVLVTEALAQTSGLLLGLSAMKGGQHTDEKRQGYFLASVNMKYLTPAKPGQTLRLVADLVKGFAGLFLFNVAAFVEDIQVAKGKLALAEERE